MGVVKAVVMVVTVVEMAAPQRRTDFSDCGLRGTFVSLQKFTNDEETDLEIRKSS